MRMNPEEIQTTEQHKEYIFSTLKERGVSKYDVGQEEHGGRLWRKNVLSMMGDEIIDFVVYFSVLEQQVKRAAEILDDARSLHEPYNLQKEMTKAYNVLTIGNEEGIPEEER